MFSGRSPSLLLLGACVLAGAVSGCSRTDPEFVLNRVYLARQMKEIGADTTPPQLPEVAASLVAMFGTPDDPYVVTSEAGGLGQLLDPSLIRMAAGPVGRDPNGNLRGLYRQHCVHCHGTTGDGKGPTAAFLNPYPRDFRSGVFKFKSTPKGEKPTHADLRKTLVEGIPGTAMPSFKLLDSDEIEALLQYVQYLSIRGEVERALLNEVTVVLEPEEKLDTAPEYLVDTVLAEVVGKWTRAETSATPVPARPQMQGEELTASIDRGRELFAGTIANCVKCHGVTALGDGQQTDYDDWSKEFEDWTKPLDAAEREEQLIKFQVLGGLPPRNIIPRNLRQGVYRGGRRPVDLYWRIRNGIDGSPMPAAMMKPEGVPNAPGLTENDLWDLVNYVQSLPTETLSLPPPAVIENVRQNP